MNEKNERMYTQMCCAKHPNTELTFSHYEITKSSSAMRTVILKTLVDPCPECEWEYDQFKRSVEIIIDQKKLP